MSDKQVRINLTLTPGMHEQIESYADNLGIRVTEAARYLMIRGLEQIRVIQTSADSARALKGMTEVFEKELEAQAAAEEERKKQEKKANRTKSKKDRVLVTPDLRPENRKSQNPDSRVKDIFND